MKVTYAALLLLGVASLASAAGDEVAELRALLKQRNAEVALLQQALETHHAKALKGRRLSNSEASGAGATLNFSDTGCALSNSAPGTLDSACRIVHTPNSRRLANVAASSVAVVNIGGCALQVADEWGSVIRSSCAIETPPSYASMLSVATLSRLAEFDAIQPVGYATDSDDSTYAQVDHFGDALYVQFDPPLTDLTKFEVHMPLSGSDEYSYRLASISTTEHLMGGGAMTGTLETIKAMAGAHDWLSLSLPGSGTVSHLLIFGMGPTKAPFLHRMRYTKSGTTTPAYVEGNSPSHVIYTLDADQAADQPGGVFRFGKPAALAFDPRTDDASLDDQSYAQVTHWGDEMHINFDPPLTDVDDFKVYSPWMNGDDYMYKLNDAAEVAQANIGWFAITVPTSKTVSSLTIRGKDTQPYRVPFLHAVQVNGVQLVD